MNTSNFAAVIADDLTGADDTALQFFAEGARVQTAVNIEAEIDESFNTQVFAFSTESRNLNKEEAAKKVLYAAENVLKKYNFEYIYKKIDSVLRGNIAVETAVLLDALNYDAALIFPAFPDEGRTSIGGFQLLNGIPVQRTEYSQDVKYPVTESNILNIFKNSFPAEKTGLIPLDIVMKGAAPVLSKLNELISNGCRFIAADAVSNADLEQTALALSKSPYKILPAGSAGAARALSRIWHSGSSEEKAEVKIPELPNLIISGSASNLTAEQIKNLKNCTDIENKYLIPLKTEDISSGRCSELSAKISALLENKNTVIVHTSELIENTGMFDITDYLAAVLKNVFMHKEAVLITIGGETSYKCLNAIECRNIKFLDTAAPAVPLCIDSKGRYIITKSGNLGNGDTLIDIIKYLEQK